MRFSLPAFSYKRVRVLPSGAGGSTGRLACPQGGAPHAEGPRDGRSEQGLGLPRATVGAEGWAMVGGGRCGAHSGFQARGKAQGGAGRVSGPGPAMVAAAAASLVTRKPDKPTKPTLGATAGVALVQSVFFIADTHCDDKDRTLQNGVTNFKHRFQALLEYTGPALMPKGSFFIY